MTHFSRQPFRAPSAPYTFHAHVKMLIRWVTVSNYAVII